MAAASTSSDLAPSWPESPAAGAPARAEDEPAEVGARGAWLPWPRSAEDGTPLGIDLSHRLVGKPPRPDPLATTGQRVSDAVRALVLHRLEHRPLPAYVRHEPCDVVQRVLETLLRRNHQPSAYDPRRASFSKYVLTVARTAILNLIAEEQRHADVILGGGMEGGVLELDEEPRPGAWQLGPAAPGPDEVLEAREEGEALLERLLAGDARGGHRRAPVGWAERPRDGSAVELRTLDVGEGEESPRPRPSPRPRRLESWGAAEQAAVA